MGVIFSKSGWVLVFGYSCRNVVDQCWLAEPLYERVEDAERGGGAKSFKGGGKVRDRCFPRIGVDILIVGGEGYRVVSSSCIELLWLFSSDPGASFCQGGFRGERGLGSSLGST